MRAIDNNVPLTPLVCTSGIALSTAFAIPDALPKKLPENRFPMLLSKLLPLSIMFARKSLTCMLTPICAYPLYKVTPPALTDITPTPLIQSIVSLTVTLSALATFPPSISNVPHGSIVN